MEYIDSLLYITWGIGFSGYILYKSLFKRTNKYKKANLRIDTKLRKIKRYQNRFGDSCKNHFFKK